MSSSLSPLEYTREENRMAETSFLDAVDLFDSLRIESNSSRAMKNEVPILKQELRSLATFLKHTANRCTEDENLQHLFDRIGDVGRAIVKLNNLASSRARKSAVDNAVRNIREKIKLLKPQIRNVQMNVLSSSGSGTCMIEGPAAEFIDSARALVKPEAREYQIQVSRLSISALSVSELIQFIGTLQDDLGGFLRCDAEGSVKEEIKVLKRKLGFLKALLSLTAHRCKKHDKLNQLLAHVQDVVDKASFLATYCLSNETDDCKKHRLALALSDLAQKIDPGTPEAREIYVGVLKGSTFSQAESNILGTDETLADFVDSLLENTWGLLRGDMMPVKDQVEILHLELRSLRYVIKDVDKDIKDGKIIYFLARAEVIIINAGYVIYSLFEDDENQEIVKETRLALSELLNKFKDLKMQIRKSYLNIEKARISNFPRTDGRRAFDLLLQNLDELLNDSFTSIELLRDHIQVIQRDLQFLLSVMPSELQSFLNTVTEQRHENEKIDDLWRRIIRVVYEVEYVIDLFLVKDGPILHHLLWLSDLIEGIKLIKTKITMMNKIQILDELQGHEIPKESSGSWIRLGAYDYGIDEEVMVGFEEEKAEIEKELVSGSPQLQIISIVGMPGLGKTFLARRVYSDPRIINHFYVQGWCYVSQHYERKELLIEILSHMEKYSKEMTTWTDEELAALLRRSLKGQRYLIVLDDIWDIEAWHVLERSFPDDRNGSRIIFTSRISELASQARQSSKIHQLRLLSDTESWELFKGKVFRKENFPFGLHEIGKRIAKNCHGLPLAIVVIGGLLAEKGKVQEAWSDIAHYLSPQINNESKGLDVINLSYNHLPNHLKSCFLYCGAFLPAKEIPITKLIRLLIAEGFVQENNANLEFIAEGYLLDLIHRSLIIVSKRKSSGGLKACVIHDLVRNFCVAKAKEEDFLQLIEAHADSCPSYPRSFEQYRLSVHYRRREKFWSKSSGPYVRSLLLSTPGRLDLWQDEVSSVILGFKLLKVLDLMCVNLGDTFPERIASLALLRYLAISGSFKSLPSSIANLGKLKSFLVEAVHLISLSYDGILKNLTKLYHLHIDGPMSLVQSSSDKHSQLDSLQTLSTPSFSCADDMEVLKRFPHLKKLSCIFEESWDFSGLSILENLQELESLKISYDGTMRYSSDEFSLPRNIKKLTMSGFRLRWEQMSIIAGLHNLEVLKLHPEAFEGEEWNMEEEVFPKLKFLKLESLDIGKWTASDRGDDHFPLLERLILEDCAQLEEIDPFLEDICTLKMIQVVDCNPPLEESMKQFLANQEDLGNEDFQLIIKSRETEVTEPSSDNFLLIQASDE